MGRYVMWADGQDSWSRHSDVPPNVVIPETAQRLSGIFVVG